MNDAVYRVWEAVCFCGKFFPNAKKAWTEFARDVLPAEDRHAFIEMWREIFGE